MLKNDFVATAVLALATALSQTPATAQHWHGYDHGAQHHANGHHANGHHGYPSAVQGYFEPHSPAPFDAQHHHAGSHFADSHHHDPNGFHTHAQIPNAYAGSMQQVPNNRQMRDGNSAFQPRFPNAAADSAYVHGHQPNAGHGHDHGDHNHDGHFHGAIDPDPGYSADNFATPDRQPMAAPTLPNQNGPPIHNMAPIQPRLDGPSNRQAPQSPAIPNDGPVIMDGPPPSLTVVGCRPIAIA
ncbi:hypothetical protein K227x_33840 [Rubripirellula lacrimiformis]|uniref:Uncharacterized protein n=1 Tax=Rubripirellula lacrimiformis TaxID=1930273 RepID=A0A517ND06_9BACT|nr:hypothetical protein [Rubripirellula lacrimiformis]QDT04986.1 hypothetical protein K227x_33840 [Rubripirellula lacrimiformis]